MGDVERPPLDWSLCCLCRVTTSEELSQPWRGRGRGESEHHDEQQGEATAGYRSFETNILKFQELGSVPLNVCPAELNDGSGIANVQLLKSHTEFGVDTTFLRQISVHL